MLRDCPNLTSLKLDLCTFLEPSTASPSFNKVLRETHFSKIERLEVRNDGCEKKTCFDMMSNSSLSQCQLLVFIFFTEVTGEVPSNVSSLLLLRSGHLRHLHLSRPPVTLVEKLLETGIR